MLALASTANKKPKIAFQRHPALSSLLLNDRSQRHDAPSLDCRLQASTSSQCDPPAAYPVVPGSPKCGILMTGRRGGGDGHRWPGRDRLPNSNRHFPTRRVARRSCSNGAGRTVSSARPAGAARGGAEEPGAHLRMPRLRSSDLDHGGHSDASLEAAADGVVLGRASDVDAFQRNVGAAVGGSARPHLQDRLAADTEAAAIDGRSGP